MTNPEESAMNPRIGPLMDMEGSCPNALPATRITSKTQHIKFDMNRIRTPIRDSPHAELRRCCGVKCSVMSERTQRTYHNVYLLKNTVLILYAPYSQRSFCIRIPYRFPSRSTQLENSDITLS